MSQMCDNAEHECVDAPVPSSHSSSATGFWRGFVMEFFFPGPDNSTYKLTTQAAIIPDTYPFEPCVAEACMKSLV